MENLKEWLNTKTFEYKQAACMFGHSEWIEIPEGAEIATKGVGKVNFWKNQDREFYFNIYGQWSNNCGETLNEYLGRNPKVKIVWQRATHPEALPFIDDNPQSLNDQYAEIEQVRQASKDNVNHPSHYTQGKVECIDALESATIGKSGIEAVCVANIIKYLWRYEEKNGLEDIKKANFYLNRLIATLENNNG